MLSNQVILVDENDNQIGLMEKLEVHQKGLLHRAVSVFIINSKGEWLMQQRAKGKYHSELLWTNTCCSHPYPNETTTDAANRRLMEEMGMKADLKFMFKFQYKAILDNNLTENELDHIFVGISDDVPLPNPVEVVDFKYVNSDFLASDIAKHPEKYTEWFKLLFSKVVDKV